MESERPMDPTIDPPENTEDRGGSIPYDPPIDPPDDQPSGGNTVPSDI